MSRPIPTPRDFRIRLGQRVRELRVASGMTQAEAASRARVARSTLCCLEAGSSTTSVYLLVCVASALGASPIDLIMSVLPNPAPASR